MSYIDPQDQQSFMNVKSKLDAIEQKRIDILVDRYGIMGLNSDPRDVRPNSLLCNIDESHMFSGLMPGIGDIVAIGSFYGTGVAYATVGTLVRFYPHRTDRPWCRDLGPQQRFAWRMERTIIHTFEEES